MKILVLSHMYPSSVNPTYGIFIHEQVKAFIEEGLEIKVISPIPFAPWPLSVLRDKWRMYASIPEKDVFEGVEVYYPRYPEFPRSYLLEHSGYFMYLGLRSLVKNLYKDFPFDLIHAHVALPDGHGAFCLKKDYPVPTVVSIHGQDFQSTLHKGDKCKARLFEVLRGTDKIITVSSKLRNIVKDEPFAEKIVVINNGIDLDGLAGGRGLTLPRFDRNLSESSKALSNLGRVRPLVKLISVSNLKKTKGIDLNLQAIAALVKDYPKLQYHIVGDGEERPNLERLVDKLGLEDHVVFLGKQPHKEALHLMGMADIFSLPSWQEGFGVVYIEAMAQGIPVIGVKGEGIEDVIKHGENGLLVRPQEVEDLVEALRSLLEDPQYAARLAQAGKETVHGSLTWHHNAVKTKELYESILRRGSFKKIRL